MPESEVIKAASNDTLGGLVVTIPRRARKELDISEETQFRVHVDDQGRLVYNPL